MQVGNSFRCYPTKSQASLLSQWIGAQRFIYNAKVSEDRYFRRYAKTSLSMVSESVPVDQQYAQFKTDLTEWMKEIPSQVLRNGATRWKQAYQRYFKKLSGRPVIKTRHGRQSVWLTKELFEFKDNQLFLGTKKHPIGFLEFKTHKSFKIPNSIHVSVHAGRWLLSFSYDNEFQEPDEKDVITWLQQFNHEELALKTLGIDRGVVNPVSTSQGEFFKLPDMVQKRLLKKESQKKYWQRKQSKRVKGSANYRKAKYRVARYSQYASDVRKDFCHKTSHALVNKPDIWLIAFEKLVLKNMTKRAKGKGRKAKSGLNRSLLNSSLGTIKTFTTYKAKRLGKLVVEVPAHYSSQECSHCGYTHQDNRLTQSEFICQRCGHNEHADYNASKIISKRGVDLVLSNGLKSKSVKRCNIFKSVGQEMSNPNLVTQI